MKAFVNCDIFTGKEVLSNHAILVSDGKIADIVDYNNLEDGFSVIDLEGQCISHGFIDLQVNGGGGVLLNDDASIKAVRKVVQAHQAMGTTHIFPTVFTSSFERMKELANSCMKLFNENIGIAGIHFEGPIINEGKAGVHDKTHIQINNDDIIEFYIEIGRKMPVLVTLAPELIDVEIIEKLSSNNVLVMAGHTNASYDQFIPAVDAGLLGATHLYNAMSGPASREPGVVGACLSNDKCWASIIADGFHVHWASVRLAWKAMRKGKLFLVTDAMPCVGSDVETFNLSGLEVFVRNNRCETKEGVLAGSALTMAGAVQNCIQKIGISKDEAIKMATLYPASFANLKEDIGLIRKGSKANFVVFDNEMHVTSTIVNGEIL